jgi:hypothetical protein
MSAAIPCTRASAQRLAFRSIRSKRFASTETLAIDPAEPILPAKTSTWKPDLSQRLHKALYPEWYGEDGEPLSEKLRASARRPQPRKPIDAKWQTVMQQKTVNRTLSTFTSSLYPKHHTPLLLTPKANAMQQATNSASQSSNPQPATSRKPAPTPSQP